MPIPEEVPPPSPFRWPLPLDAIWLAAPIICLLFVAAIVPIPPNDYWWATVMGRYIHTSGTLPTTNLFLYTLPSETPFFNQPWLAQLLLYLHARYLSHGANTTTHLLLLLLTWLPPLALALKRSDDPRPIGAATLGLIMLAATVFSVRTQMYAFACFGPFLGLLLAHAQGRITWRPMLLCLPLTTLWANVHGSFILAPLFLGATTTGLCLEQLLEERRIPWKTLARWSGWTAAVFAACLINPRGPMVFYYVIKLSILSDIPSTSTEWLPVSVTTPLGLGMVLTTTLACLTLALRRKHVPLHEVILFGACLYLGASQQRSLVWFALICLPVVLPQALQLLPFGSRDPAALETSTGQGIAHACMLAMLTALTLFSIPSMPLHPVMSTALIANKARLVEPQAHIVSNLHAPALLAQLAERRWHGRIFHHESIGGEIEFVLADPRGEPIAFVDQRFELTSAASWKDYFLISEAHSGWQQRLTHWKIGTLLLNPEDQWPLIQAVQQSEDWLLVGADTRHLLFLHRDSEPALLERWSVNTTRSR